MNKLDLAYIGGIIDGEGCITITRTSSRKRMSGKSYDLYVTVAMCDEETPRWLYENFRGSLTLQKKPKPHHRDVWRWRLASLQARDFLILIEPYLRMKRAQAKLGVQFQNSRKPSGFYSRHNLKPQSVVEFEEHCWRIMRALNHTATWKEAKDNAT